MHAQSEEAQLEVDFEGSEDGDESTDCELDGLPSLEGVYRMQKEESPSAKVQ